jgi:hypothetical protein
MERAPPSAGNSAHAILITFIDARSFGAGFARQFSSGGPAFRLCATVLSHERPQEIPMNFNNLNINYQSPVFIIGVVVLLAIAVIVAVIVDRRRKTSLRLRNRFGAEYDYCLREHKARDKAEADLEGRIQRVNQLKIRELTGSERARLVAEWDSVQSRFIDHPRGAVTEADELVNAVMQTQGFPASGFVQRAADISVHHAHLVDSYRTAHEITVSAANNEATTEELRTAMIHYRALFDELLQIKAPVVHRQVA